jgi:hypothetical protein
MDLLNSQYNLGKHMHMELAFGMRHKDTELMKRHGVFLGIKKQKDDKIQWCVYHQDTAFSSTFDNEEEFKNKMVELFNSGWQFMQFFDMSMVCYGMGETKREPFWQSK